MHREKMARSQTCFFFDYVHIVLTAEPRDQFLGPESDVRTGATVLLVQP